MDELGFRPFGGNIPAEARDKYILLAAGNVQIAVIVHPAKVARAYLHRVPDTVFEVAEHGLPVDDDLAVGIDFDR